MGSGADFTLAAIAAEKIARADITWLRCVLSCRGWLGLLFENMVQRCKKRDTQGLPKGDTFLG